MVNSVLESDALIFLCSRPKQRPNCPGLLGGILGIAMQESTLLTININATILSISIFAKVKSTKTTF